MRTQPLQFLLLLFAGWVNRRQLEVIDYLKEKTVRGRALGRKILGYRQLVADKYDGSGRRGPGRPGIVRRVQELVVRFAKENPGWGYTRLRGALRNLGHVIGSNTVKRILDEHGLEPAPERSKRMPWKTFIKAHLGAIAATDFINVEVLSLVGLVRYSVLFVIDLQTRRVQIAGIVRQPYGAWMTQVARNLTDGVDGFLKGTKYLIPDRDPLFTQDFRALLGDAGVKCVKLPAHSPDLNAYAERFVLSIKSECLNKLVLLGEGQLRRGGERIRRALPPRAQPSGTRQPTAHAVAAVETTTVRSCAWSDSAAS